MNCNKDYNLFILVDYMNRNPGFRTEREVEQLLLVRGVIKPLPMRFKDKVGHYASSHVLKAVYRIVMMRIEDSLPNVAGLLNKLGLPKGYEPRVYDFPVVD